MTAVVRYKIPYIVQGSVPIIHLIALGNDVSLCCVLELSTILSIGVVTNFLSRELSCAKLKKLCEIYFNSPYLKLSSRVFKGETVYL